ncbi:MAG: sulfotransferase family 2 domain-containing protein, partial [bacterium]|nr:sulfotransferase family 2 domain-containing protein [bacterium]
IIFTHLPRSGGTTLDSYISKEYSPYEMFHFYVRKKAGNIREAMEEFTALPQDKKQQLKLLVGHTSFGIHRFFDRFTYITLFRDPIERLVSYYFHVLNNDEHYLHNIVMTNRMKLDDFVCSGISTEFDNDQTRQLAGVENVPFGKCTQEMLDEAKRNFEENYTVFGITERFDESLMLFSETFGLSYPFYKVLNVTRKKMAVRDISGKTLEAIREVNRFDLHLHRFAMEKFNALINQQDSSFQQRVERFKKLNGLMQKFGKPEKDGLALSLWNVYLRLKRTR